MERGRSLFANCAGCHGSIGEGVVGLAPRLNSTTYLAIISNDYVRATLKAGRPGTNMIPWGAAMSREDIDALVAYVRSWQTRDGLPLDESPLAGKAEQGGEIYGLHCARCHGGAGAGYSASGPGTAIGRRGFLDVATNGTIRAIVANGKADTPMRPFTDGKPGEEPYAVLKPEQIDAVIAWLRANAW